jgi:Arc/MetJ-type ribon-helix-helix transcriptional regulator
MARPKSPEAGTRIHIRVTKKQYAKIQRLAGQGGYSVSETIRRAIDAYLTSTTVI